MPRFKKDLTLVAKNLRAFVKFDVGVGRSVPETPMKGTREARSGERTPLQEQLVGAGQKTQLETRLFRELQEERQRRKRAEEALHNRPSVTASGEIRQQSHALPEPDESINRRRIFHSLISPLKVGRMLDLGAGPGNFSIPAAQLGWNVTAVDVRTVRRPDSEAESNPGLARLIKSIDWVESDVRDFQIKDGEYDLICVFGILHHLELDDQIALMKKCSSVLTILDCRVAPEITTTEGRYEGHYVREPGKTREDRDEIPGASWGNEKSFRHTEESLVRLLQDSGFQKVMCMRSPHAGNYTFYVALPVT